MLCFSLSYYKERPENNMSIGQMTQANQPPPASSGVSTFARMGFSSSVWKVPWSHRHNRWYQCWLCLCEKSLRRPANQKEVRFLLGLVNYYGKFVNQLHRIKGPLEELFRKDSAFNWSQKQNSAFQTFWRVHFFLPTMTLVRISLWQLMHVVQVSEEFCCNFMQMEQRKQYSIWARPSQNHSKTTIKLKKRASALVTMRPVQMLLMQKSNKLSPLFKLLTRKSSTELCMYSP